MVIMLYEAAFFFKLRASMGSDPIAVQAKPQAVFSLVHRIILISCIGLGRSILFPDTLSLSSLSLPDGVGSLVGA